MSALALIAGVALVVLALLAFRLARRRIRSGPHNNWRNEAYLARQADGSWSENECAAGREKAAPPGLLLAAAAAAWLALVPGPADAAERPANLRDVLAEPVYHILTAAPAPSKPLRSNR